MKSFKIPTQSQIDTAVQRMTSPEFAAYFLSRLENPRWIKPLSEKGVFKNPPPVSVEESRSTFPHWPATKYLARMAAITPEEVADILLDIETDNPSVIYDVVQAALAMPPAIAKRLIPAISHAAKSGTLWIAYKDSCEICAKLAEGGEVAASLELADALFHLDTAEDERDSQRDEYVYIDGLKTVTSALARIEPSVFLSRLCNWLQIAIRAKRLPGRTEDEDYSDTWRPAIEEHSQNYTFDFAGNLVSCIRAGYEKAIRNKKISLEDSLTELKNYQYLIFERLRIHLINVFAEENEELACQTILDHALLDNDRFKHEYAMLIGERWNLLSSTQREEWFDLIESGPNMSDFDILFLQHNGEEPSDQDRQHHIKCWQYRKLHWVRTHLDDKWKALYQSMLAEHGPPMFADMNTSPVRYGNESPLSEEDLENLGFQQAVETVCSWQPKKQSPWGPNIAGLADTFTRYVAANTVEFSKHAEAMIDCPQVFILGYLGQISETVKTGQKVDLTAVITLCNWVMEQPSAAETDSYDLLDSNWQRTRNQISDLLQYVCKAWIDDSSVYSIDDYRDSVWALIEQLCDDSIDSTILSDIQGQDPRSIDYLHLAINSPRGKAVESCLEYARWVANHKKVLERGRETVPGGFDLMPEVRAVLDRQIAEESRSYTGLSIIGSRINVIHWIDGNWLSTNATELFNLEGIEKTPRLTDGWAAWNTFLVWVRPHVEYYKAFKPQFAYAVLQAASVEVADNHHEEPMYHLGEHLMILYGRGQLELDQDDNLLRKFLDNSTPEIRRYAIGFIGQSLEGEAEVPPAVIERFQGLWNTYWNGPGKQDASDSPGSLLFGAWFTSGKFPDDWALAQLEEFVAIDPIPEPDRSIAARLAVIANVDIAKSLNILNRLVRGDNEGWRIYGWRDSVRTILEVAIGEATVRKQAEQLINFLGRRGYNELGELLQR